MLADQDIIEIGISLQAQNRLLQDLDLAVSEVDQSLKASAQSLSTCHDSTHQLRELQALMDELEADQNWIEEEDFGNFQPEQILDLYKKRQESVFRELTQIGYKNWDGFVRQCQIYTLSKGADPLAPYDIFLTQSDLELLRSESYNVQFKWDKWDYMFVGASGILAALTDYLLVKIPMAINTGEYAGQEGSLITGWIKQYDTTKSDDWFAQWTQSISETCKVPYDAMHHIGLDGVQRISGMTPKSHRFQSLGHDPVLGFVFGVLDIMRGTITGFSYETLTHRHTGIQEVVWSHQNPIGLIEAILRQLGHLISDVATPMGLPAPFMSLIQGLNVGSFGDKGRTAGEIARWMYLNGYDFRHFLVSGITPAVIEIILRAYIMLRHYSEYGETKLNVASNPKYRTMLLMAHGIATLGNTGKIVLMQGNPLAINYAEWMAFIRYLIPSFKYWIFDKKQLQIRHLERITQSKWNQLLQSSDELLASVMKNDSSKITLGAI